MEAISPLSWREKNIPRGRLKQIYFIEKTTNCLRGTCHIFQPHCLSDLPVYLGEVGAGPADRGRVDDRGHFVEVVFEDPVEEYLVAVMDGLQHLRKQVTTLVQ